MFISLLMKALKPFKRRILYA